MQENILSKLTFIYNAKSDPINKLLDIGHKIISPQTYNCTLCSLTYGNFAMKNEWRSYLKNCGHEFSFLYKDQNNNENPQNYCLPIVLFEKNGIKIELLNCKELSKLNSTSELIRVLNKKLHEFS